MTDKPCQIGGWDEMGLWENTILKDETFLDRFMQLVQDFCAKISPIFAAFTICPPKSTF